MSDDLYFDDNFQIDDSSINPDIGLLKLAYRNELVFFLIPCLNFRLLPIF